MALSLACALDGVKDPLAQQRKASSSISLPFAQFELRDVAFHHPVIDGPDQAISHRLLVFLDPCGKGLQLGKFAAVHLSEPAIELLSSTGSQHLSELLNQVLGQIHFGMDLAQYH